MSGRLIILPKKSYCPWNQKNVERILRDEKKDAEEKERAEKQQKLERFRALKQAKSDTNEKLEHVNLFAQEEQEMNLNYPQQKEAKPCVQNHRFGKQRVRSPRPVDKKKDEMLKKSMDPMKEFRTDSKYGVDDESIKKHSKKVDRIEQKERTKNNQRETRNIDSDSESYMLHGKEIRKSKHRSKSKRREDESCFYSDSESSTSQCRRRKYKKRKRHRNRSRRREDESRRLPEKAGPNLEELRSRRAEREKRERERQAALLK